MQLTPEQIFEVKKQLQAQIEEYEQKLQVVIQKQTTITKIQPLAESILEFNDLEREIKDRAHLFSLLSSPPESLTNPYIKAELFSYFVAAETIGPQFVDFLVDDFLTQLRSELQTDEYDSPDLIQAEFKEYVLPAKIIAEKFDQIDSLIVEMNNYCRAIDPTYDPNTQPNSVRSVLMYAFKMSITADTRMEPTIEALQKMSFDYLTTEDRAALLDTVSEHLAIIRYEKAKDQQIAMEKAVKMIADREAKGAVA